MSRAELLALSLKGLLAWLLLSIAGWYFSETLGTWLLPWFGFVINQLCPHYSPWLTLTPDSHDFTIQLNALVFHPILLGSKELVPAGQELAASTHVMHTLVPIIIELAILLVWPVRHWQDRWFLLVLGVLTSMLVVGATGPVVLVGKLEIFLQEIAEQANLLRPEPWLLTWMVFSEMGGRWLLPIVMALLCIRVQRALFNKQLVALP